MDYLLWNDLKTMFEPHVEDAIWRNQQGYKVLEWMLYDSCGVHSLMMQTMQIYMLVEKRYPLTPPIIIDMLNKKLQYKVNAAEGVNAASEEVSTAELVSTAYSNNPRKASDYRPIAYCGVVYKCVSKVITNRLKKVLNGLVDTNQGAFIEGRQISDNILLIQELMNGYTWKGNIRKCVFKVDIQKAYDTVSWDFLKITLEYFSFHSKMVN
ncbi:RNA-directed DNA polymerase, eukaryota, reverse transcriptase zinc-binding domain protein [Tanacetum coccineum]